MKSPTTCLSSPVSHHEGTAIDATDQFQETIYAGEIYLLPQSHTDSEKGANWEMGYAKKKVAGASLTGHWLVPPNLGAGM